MGAGGGLAEVLESAYDSFTNLIGLTGDYTYPEDTDNVYKKGTAEAASGMGAFGTDLPSVAVITVNRALEYKNRAAIVNLTRGVCLAKATEIAVTVAYGSVEEAQKDA